MIHVIIAGSRTFDSYDRLKYTLAKLNLLNVECTIISGTARGAGQLGERWAAEFNKPVIRMPADWNKHGKRAGYLRNEEMAKIASHLVAFWDAKSPGTGHMIDLANKYELKTHVVIIS